MRLFLILLAGFGLLLSALPAHAETGAQGAAKDTPKAAIRVIPEMNPIGPGFPFQIAIEQTIAPGWHTYWRNPGDSGMEPKITWTVPEGFSVDELQWPAPSAIPYAGLVNYGYENKVTLLQQITPPDPLPDGPMVLTANVEILVCHEICIPESSTHTVTLNAGNDTDTPGDEQIINDSFNILPTDLQWPTTYKIDGDDFLLHIKPEYPALWADMDPASLFFFPENWGAVVNSAPQRIRASGFDPAADMILVQKHDTTRPVSELGTFKVLLSFKTKGGQPRAFRVTATPDESLNVAAPAAATNAGEEQASPESRAAPAAHSTTLVQAVLFALLGGLILNLMPCVFPVLSLKALKLVELQNKGANVARMHGLAYMGGILMCFAAIAGSLIALKSGGAQIGWGFQLQNPQVVLGLSYLLFVIGLSLSGVFELGGSLAGIGQRLAGQSGLRGTFFTGVLATLVATPCTAPFMAAALGFALVQPAAVSLLVFLALGFGLGLPYLILSFVPALARVLPRPGAWMIRFRELLAFPMYASAAWLIWVMSLQSGPHGVFAALAGLVMIAFGLWVLAHRPAAGTMRWAATIAGLAAILCALFPLSPMSRALMDTPPAAMAMAAGESEAFTQARLDALLATGQPVFVNMTAAWCITCKVNERVALATPQVMDAFKNNNVAYLKGDWTNQNPEITAFLEKYGRNGVPLYVFYGRAEAGSDARPEPVVLPQILTPGIVVKTVQP